MGEWRLLLAQERRRQRLSREQLAALAHVSADAIKSYESGTRHPKRPYLVALLDALKLPRYHRNEILTGAGFASDGLLLRPDTTATAFTVDEAAVEVERYPWPAFMSDEFGLVLCANAAAQRVWDVDLTREMRDPLDRHLISIATNPRFADRCLNWDEAVGTILAGFRDHNRGHEDMDSPSPQFAPLVDRLLAGAPQYVARLADLWANAPPIDLKMRWSYRIVWDTPSIGVMRCSCFISTASEPDGYAFHDWIPVDVASWEVLTRVTSGVSAPAAN